MTVIIRSDIGFQTISRNYMICIVIHMELNLNEWLSFATTFKSIIVMCYAL